MTTITGRLVRIEAALAARPAPRPATAFDAARLTPNELREFDALCARCRPTPDGVGADDLTDAELDRAIYLALKAEDRLDEWVPADAPREPGG
jgi:hypothetical protein